jgi:hypothetical protein
MASPVTKPHKGQYPQLQNILQVKKSNSLNGIQPLIINDASDYTSAFNFTGKNSIVLVDL